jgi:hypothetical protein
VKYVEEKTTATLKFKQSSIATVRNHLLTVARFLTPLIFLYPPPLKYVSTQRDRVKEKMPAWKLGEPGTLQQVPHVAIVRPVVEQGPGQLQQKPFCYYDPDKITKK